MIVYEVAIYLNGLRYPEDQWTLDWLELALFESRWIAYGFVFGYLYPFVRGSTPTTKAAALLAAMLAPELVDLIPRFPTTGLDALAVVALVGQLVMYAIGMGLLWEHRLVRKAGVAWARIRDLRTFRAVGTPFTAVVVTIATTAATAIVGAAMTRYMEPKTGLERPPSDSATQSAK
jgi:hypothetical protein